MCVFGGGGRLVVGEALSWVLDNKVKGHLFQGNRGTKCNFLRGKGKQRKYWGTWNTGKQIFDFWATGVQANLFQGTICTPPCEGLDGQWMIRPRYIHKLYSSF